MSLGFTGGNSPIIEKIFSSIIVPTCHDLLCFAPVLFGTFAIVNSFVGCRFGFMKLFTQFIGDVICESPL